MKSSPILFREESRLPRLLTWPLVFLGAGVIATVGVGGLHGMQQSLFTLIVLGAVLSVLLLLEFVALVIEVRQNEVRFSFAPFYNRRIITANIQHWVIRTYHMRADPWTRYSWRPPKYCVELAMRDGSMVTLMSAHPEQLSHAIGEAKMLVAGH